MAFARETSQSSTAYGGVSSRAVDGDINGSFSDESTTHTRTEMEPWWQVDLGAVENIAYIDVYNRTNSCCTDRLSDFYVFVSDSEFSSTDLTTTLAQSEVSQYYYGPTVDISARFNIERTGRFVRIQLVGNTNPLSLAEVEVISGGDTLTPTPSPSPSSQGTVASLTKGELGDNDSVPNLACTQTVNSLSELETASELLVAGDTLCLANGIYIGDLSLDLTGIGTETNPITVAAEHPGEAIVTDGEVSIRLGGEHLILQGFVFRDGVSGTIVKFESDAECRHCRMTEVSIIDMNNEDPYGNTSWVELYGQHNRIDHSYFSGKTSRGALLVMPRWIDEGSFDESTWLAEHAQIDHNYFGHRPPAFGKAYADSSDNEYEAVRLGLSTTHTAVSNSIVEYNYFERIEGEAEVISNKATDNIIRYNTVRDSAGSIATRHGSGVLISHNIITGEGNPFSGGIRLVDSDHVVTNNYIEGTRYANSNWNGGIVLTTGDGSGRMENGYQDVTNILIANNTIVDSVNSINVAGGRESNLPSEIYFVNNIVQNAIGPVIRTNSEAMPSFSVLSANYVSGQSLTDNENLTTISGFDEVDAALSRGSDGLYRPSAASPDLSADVFSDISGFSLPNTDMDGQIRNDTSVSGADEPLGSDASIGLLSPSLVGPMHYTPEPGWVYVEKVNIANSHFESGDLSGWTNIGASITHDTYETFSDGASLRVDNNTASVSQTIDIDANTHYTASAFIRGLGQIRVETDGETYTAVNESTDYTFTSLSFNSGNASEAIITASLAEGVNTEAIADNDFTGFHAGSNDWTTIEGINEGDVATSSNSASGADGSVKLGYKRPSHSYTSPSIYQTIAVSPYTEFEFSLAMLVKNGSSSTATLRIEGNNSVVVDDIALVYAQLDDIGLDDSFNQFSLPINSGDNTELTVSVTYDPHDIIGDQTPDIDGTLSSDTQQQNELRIDNISMISQSAAPEGTEAFFDDFRLVSHPLSPEESLAVSGE